MLIETPVVDYVKRAVAKELEKSGFVGADPRLLLDVQIGKFGIQQNAFSIDSVFTGSFVLRSSDGSRRIERPFEKSRHHSVGAKPKSVIQDLNGMISETYEDFFAESDVQSVIGAAAR